MGFSIQNHLAIGVPPMFGTRHVFDVRFSVLQRGGTGVSDPRQLRLREARGAETQSAHEAAHRHLQGGVAGCL